MERGPGVEPGNADRRSNACAHGLNLPTIFALTRPRRMNRQIITKSLAYRLGIILIDSKTNFNAPL